MPNLVKENKQLREEQERLQAELTALKSGNPADHKYSGLSEEDDGRQEPVEIVYRNPYAPEGAMGAAKFVKEVLPLQQAFDKLVEFYSAFSRATDRNVPKDFWDGRKPISCNDSVCYVKKTFVDIQSGQKIENLKKEVPLWLAVDDRVQKDQQVELISRKEYSDFYREHVKAELRREKAFQESKNRRALEELIQEEL